MNKQEKCHIVIFPSKVYKEGCDESDSLEFFKLVLREASVHVSMFFRLLKDRDGLGRVWHEPQGKMGSDPPVLLCQAPSTKSVSSFLF